MSGIILRPNKELREKTLNRLQRHHEAAEGKNDLLKTWEEFIIQPNEEDCRYISDLKRRIRKERVLLSHIRP